MIRAGTIIGAVLLAALALASNATAAGSTPVPSGFPETPSDYAISAREAVRIADTDPKIVAREAALAGDDSFSASVQAEPVRVWEVGYFLNDEKVNLVIVDATTGAVTQSWTGAAVDWPMARGKPGQFGHILNSPWVWIPLALVFLLGLFDFRRPGKWVHLDLLVLLSFGVSEAFFNAAEIGVSVPLVYPPLVYLLLRMLWIGFRGHGLDRTAGEGLRPSAPVWLLTIAVAALIVLRLTANLSDSGVIDVGYAGVIGADKITHAEPIYGDSFPDDNPTGDTYGPANYFAYVPFEAAFPWSGSWDDLPAAHAATIFFDLATVAGLFALGLVLVRRRRSADPDDEEPAAAPAGGGRIRRRLRAWFPDRDGNVLGLVLVFAWVAYPFTAYAMQGNSNDELISALLVWSLVFFASPIARGGLLAVASMTKFAPLMLVPLYAAGGRGIRIRTRDDRRAALGPLVRFALSFLFFAGLLLAYPAVDPGLGAFWERTVESQLDRDSPFSIWGQADLEWLQTILKAGLVALAIVAAFFPWRRTLIQIAALAAALVIGVELILEHWFYLYIPWFLGLMLVALVARDADDVSADTPIG
ncbi:MAG TPA: PepSY domain-containing protein [Solirubrobacterales bacterium]|nr:PepSY domain-containing protein [Solirubrobacterales bacterium]